MVASDSLFLLKGTYRSRRHAVIGRNAEMNAGPVARLLSISSSTLHRWADCYSDFLDSNATPQKGQARVFSEHDVRVMLLVSDLRHAGASQDHIRQALQKESLDHWRNLPSLSEAWNHNERNVTVPGRLLVHFEHQQTAHEDMIGQQRMMLQVLAGALQLKEMQCAEQEIAVRSLKRRQRVHRIILIALGIVCGAMILVVWLA